MTEKIYLKMIIECVYEAKDVNDKLPMFCAVNEAFSKGIFSPIEYDVEKFFHLTDSKGHNYEWNPEEKKFVLVTNDD